MQVHDPRVLAVCEGRDVVGIAPFFVWGAAPARTVSPLGVGVSDHLDVIAATGFERCTLDAVTEFLEREAGTWNACSFEELGPQALLRDLRTPAGRATALRQQSVCPVLSMPSDFPSVETVIPRPQIQKLRKDQRRARGIGPLAFERADRCDAEGALRLLFTLHQKRWERRGEPGVLGDPRIRALHADAAALFGACGELRLYVLHIGGTPAAVVYGLRWGPRLYLYMQGIEPALDRASPGTLILGFVLDDAIHEGVTEIDFLRGAEPYKYAWGAVDEVNIAMTLT
jgi:CelD/BcsL family acetyltransferase involved in cellulose biosynthesis